MTATMKTVMEDAATVLSQSVETEETGSLMINPSALAVLQAISNHANKNEIAGWNRKRKAIERVIETHIRPLEDKIMELNAQLMPLYDQLNKMRGELTEFCVHPIDMLIYKDGHVVCKFCSAKLNVPVRP